LYTPSYISTTNETGKDYCNREREVSWSDKTPLGEYKTLEPDQGHKEF